MKPLVIIPTYNEAENITRLIEVVRGVEPEVEILVVDDNSPDGTGAHVAALATQDRHVHLLERPGKQGLGRAYVAGFRWGLDSGYDLLIEMDADFSHRPEDLRRLLEAAQSHDFVVGSRWIKGGATKNWSWLRTLISRGGSLYSRWILGFGVRDWTGGFNAWHRPVLEAIGLNTIKSDGYSFQVELKYRALRKGFRGIEVPIIFEDRRVGQSKMSSRIVLEALYRVLLLRWHGGQRG